MGFSYMVSLMYGARKVQFHGLLQKTLWLHQERAWLLLRVSQPHWCLAAWLPGWRAGGRGKQHTAGRPSIPRRRHTGRFNSSDINYFFFAKATCLRVFLGGGSGKPQGTGALGTTAWRRTLWPSAAAATTPPPSPSWMTRSPPPPPAIAAIQMAAEMVAMSLLGPYV